MANARALVALQGEGESLDALVEMNFPGYAIGGVSVGEPEPEMLKQVAATTPFLPAEKPRYTMGLGTPSQILKMIGLGVDMFDCVHPTRVGRNGAAFTPDGLINLRNEVYRTDPRPVVEGMDNYTCRHFSRAYLRHLAVAGEMLAATLLTIHNLTALISMPILKMPRNELFMENCSMADKPA